MVTGVGGESPFWKWLLQQDLGKRVGMFGGLGAWSQVKTEKKGIRGGSGCHSRQRISRASPGSWIPFWLWRGEFNAGWLRGRLRAFLKLICATGQSNGCRAKTGNRVLRSERDFKGDSD